MAGDLQIPLWPDNPTAEDLLGFTDVAEPIVAALNRDRLDPVAIGVSGDWGSGKTTVLELIAERFSDDESVVVVFTRPWEYDPATDPKATLIAEVLAAVEERAKSASGGTLSGDLKKRFTGLAKRVKWSKAITLAANSALTLSPPKFQDVIDIFGKGTQAASDPTLQGFRDEYEVLMGKLGSVTRVVVLVDDLDRCLPESVIGALEAIKLFLSVMKMGFVVAADERLVTHAIATRYEGASQADRMALQYLEKIVQIPVRVPALGESDTEAYLTLLVVHPHLFPPAEPGGETDATQIAEAKKRFEAIVAHCAANRAESAKRVLEGLDNELIPESAKEDVALARQLTPVLATRLSGNPRRIKRFMNAYWLRSDIARRRKAALDGPVLAKLLVLEQLDPKEFEVLLEWLNDGALADRLAKIEDAETPDALDVKEKSLFTWAKSPPALAEVELDTYLRLAASLRSLPGAPSDLRPELQDLLDRLTSGSRTVRKGAQGEAKALADEGKFDLLKEAVRLMVADPSRQDDIAESLVVLAESEAVAGRLAEALPALDASAVDPSLVVRFRELEPIKPVIGEWLESGRMSEMAENAAKQALGKAED